MYSKNISHWSCFECIGMTSQGVLFFDRMTEDVLDGIRSELEVSRVCQHFGTYSYLMIVEYGGIHLSVQ